MKIAIATEGSNVSGHFGKCENFTIVEIESSQVKNKVVVNTQGNQHGLLPAFLASHGANLVITGGMGDGARQKLAAQNIDIISGVSGSIDEVVDTYLNGTLKSNGAGCSGHEYSHEHSHGEGGCSCGRN
jgi:predicted Fe-Mo cluster-binding NifX family protein